MRAFRAPIDRRALGIWVVVGLIGMGIVLAGHALLASWRIDRAGVILNRHLGQDDRDGMPAVLAALGSPGSNGDPSFWRTYGAAAVRRPTDEAFARLAAAQDRGELDRIGELWLGEVAAATGHWEVARQAYSKVNVANILVQRADAAMEAHKREQAMRWYGVAATSLRAARERELQRPTGERAFYASEPTPIGGETMAPGGLAVLLLRIGCGFLNLEHPEEAIPVLKSALTEMQTDPPGLRERQSIQFSLAQALAESTLPEDRRSRLVDTAEARPEHAAPIEIETQARDLALAALELDDTGWAQFQSARVMALLGDRVSAIRQARRALELDPTLVDAYLTLGTLHETAGLTNLARDVYEQGLEHVSSSEQLQVAWALASAKTLPPEEAIVRLEKVAKSNTRDPYLFAALGDMYFELGRDVDGITSYREGLRRAPGARPLLDRLALVGGPRWRWR